MDRFRRLAQIVLLSGAAAGVALFLLQRVVVIPLLQTAETYETAAARGDHPHEEWQPDEGAERTAYTALGTVLLGIAWAAVLFGGAALAGVELDVRRGVIVALAAFACVTLAPAFGLPPSPPDAAVGDLRARQLWWIATAGLTAAGLFLILRARGNWTLRAIGAFVIALPHLVGAPAATEASLVPAALERRFAVASVATAGLFWMVLGAAGGYLSGRAADQR